MKVDSVLGRYYRLHPEKQFSLFLIRFVMQGLSDWTARLLSGVCHVTSQLRFVQLSDIYFFFFSFFFSPVRSWNEWASVFKEAVFRWHAVWSWGLIRGKKSENQSGSFFSVSRARGRSEARTLTPLTWYDMSDYRKLARAVSDNRSAEPSLWESQCARGSRRM